MKRFSLRLLVSLAILLLLTSQVAYAERNREILRLGRGTSQITQWRKDGEGYAVKTPTGVELHDASGTLLNTLNFPEGRMDYPGTLHWSPNAAYIALILNNYSQEGTISITRIWSVKNADQLLYTLVTSDGSFNWKPDNTQFALAGRIYDVTTGQLVFIHKYGAECFNCGETHNPKDRIYEGGVIDWSPDGRRFISTSYTSLGSSGYYRGVFDASNDTLLFNLEDGRDNRSFIVTFLWSSDSSKFTDGYRIWNASNGHVVAAVKTDQITEQYKNSAGMCNTAMKTWSSDNNSLFTISNNTDCLGAYGQIYSVLYRWDVTTGNVLSQQPFSRQIISFQREHGNLVAHTQEGHRLLIDEATGTVKDVDYTNTIFPVNSMAWSPDSKKLVAIAIGSPNLPMQMWDIETIRKGAISTPLWTTNVEWFNSEREALTYPPDQAKLLWNESGLVTVTEDPYYLRAYDAVTQWDTTNGHLQNYLYWSQLEFLPPTAEPSPDLKYLAVTNTHWLQDSGETSFPVEIVDTSAKRVIKRFMTNCPDILYWSPDGHYLAAVGWSRNMTQIWDISGDTPNMIVELKGGVESPIVWSHDSQKILIQDKVYEIPSGKNTLDIPQFTSARDTRNNLAAWSPSGNQIVTSTYNWSNPKQSTVRVYTTSTGFSPLVKQIDGYVKALSLAPDGTTLALGMDDGTIRIWDVADLMTN